LTTLHDEGGGSKPSDNACAGSKSENAIPVARECAIKGSQSEYSEPRRSLLFLNMLL